MSLPAILLVEDSDFLIQVLWDLLREDFEVTIARTAREAIEKAKKSAPRVVVTDIILPDLSGVDVARAIRTLPGLEQVPVIALTSQSEESLPAGGRAHFNEFLVKPFGIDQLSDTIKKCMGGT